MEAAALLSFTPVKLDRSQRGIDSQANTITGFHQTQIKFFLVPFIPRITDIVENDALYFFPDWETIFCSTPKHAVAPELIVLVTAQAVAAAYGKTLRQGHVSPGVTGCQIKSQYPIPLHRDIIPIVYCNLFKLKITAQAGPFKRIGIPFAGMGIVNVVTCCAVAGHFPLYL